MKLLLLADEPNPRLWDHLDRRLLEGVELVLSCGDLPASYLSFLTCFTNAPILYVHGNHDTRYDLYPPEGCICIEDQVYVHNGLRILGMGGSMRYKPGTHQYTEREMARRMNRMTLRLCRTRGFDILLTHAPMAGVGDGTDLPHRGFETFKRAVDKYHPAYHIHGHVHKEYDFRFRRERQYGETTVINAWMSHILEIDMNGIHKNSPPSRRK